MAQKFQNEKVRPMKKIYIYDFINDLRKMVKDRHFMYHIDSTQDSFDESFFGKIVIKISDGVVNIVKIEEQSFKAN